jgi:hypothetical protein
LVWKNNREKCVSTKKICRPGSTYGRSFANYYRMSIVAFLDESVVVKIPGFMYVVVHEAYGVH